MATIKTKVLDSVIVLKGLNEIFTGRGVSRRSFRSESFMQKANWQNLEKIDQALGQLLNKWGFSDKTWRFSVQTAVNELLTNVIQQHLPGRRGGTRHYMHLLCISNCDRNYRYFYALVNGNGVAIDVTRLKTTLPEILSDSGRGCPIVMAMANLYAVVKDTDLVLIMKKMKKNRASKKAGVCK